jgi:diguanylate cyclase (GGDEF)-like protein/PAS domain S-box-containing protein
MGEQRATSSSGAAGRPAARRRAAAERGQQPELGLLNRLALAIADAPDFDAALGTVLSEVGQATGWDCGQAWVPTSDGTGLACRPVWYGDRKAFARFRSVSEGTVFAPGVGLPGRAWANRRPAWLRDLAADTNFPRWPVAKAAGLRTGMAIPVLAGREVAAVLEFFVVEERSEDEELVAFISAIGALLGSALARRRAEEGLRESEERFRSVVQSAIDAVVLADTAGMIVGWNSAAERIFGYTESEVSGRPLTVLMPERFHEAHQAGLGRLARGGPPSVLGTVLELVGRRQDGTEFPLELSLSTWAMAGAACFSGIVRDITERKRAEEALRESEVRFRSVVESAIDAVVLADTAGMIVGWNAAAERAFGYTEPEVLGRPLTLLMPERFHEAHQAGLGRLARGGPPGVLGTVLELVGRRQDGTEFPLELSLSTWAMAGAACFSGIVRDITERKRAEEALAQDALHDSLTGLPNRSLLLDRLGAVLSRLARRPSVAAVLFIAIDNLKVVTDSLGHVAGDRLLVQVAERLRAVTRMTDTLARFGGDEFVLLCDDLGERGQAALLAERIRALTKDPFVVDGRKVHLSISVGIRFAEASDRRPEELLRDADAAMQRAKAQGRSRHEVFDDSLRAAVVVRFETELALRAALERSELRVWYQSLVSLADPGIVGAEALLRWEHPGRGLLSPAEFIPVAEQTGLIVPIGNWVLGEACRQLAEWRRRRAPRLAVSVNVSAVQLAQPDLPRTVADILAQEAVDPAAVWLEITESVLMDDPESALGTLTALKHLGIRLAIDDFGTGYSSLSYLRRFPIDALKIDRSFVRGLGHDDDDAAVVRLIIHLARDLGLVVMAEGVETEEQLEELISLGCDRAQGFYFARPVESDVFTGYLGSMEA